MEKSVQKTMRKQVQVTNAKTTRVKTGVTELDKLIKGGLIKKSITLVVGGAGSGKTIFAMQFIKNGLEKGETCLYITFEEKKGKLYGDMKSFGWDFAQYEADNKFFYLEYAPEQVKALIEEGGGTVDQLITKQKITRLVIDSVTSFSLLYQDMLSRKEAGLALFELINKWGCTAVLTSQSASRKGDLPASSLEFEADAIIIFYHSRVKGERMRALEILKMRGTPHSNKTMEMKIDNSGITVIPSHVMEES
jgi:circadian clock protein KaiC